MGKILKNKNDINKSYELAIVLSNHINEDNSLDIETNFRVQVAIDLIKNKNVKKILLSGGYADKNATITHAKAMEKKLILNNIEKEKIILEEFSLDSVGQAFFTKMNYIQKNNIFDFLVITHNYHINRVKTIFDFIFGPKFNIDYFSISTNYNEEINLTNINYIEENKLNIFKKTFENVSSGDDENIKKTLFNKHKLYSNFNYN